MPTDEIIIRLFCMVDDTLQDVNNRPDAHLYPSEVVTIGLLFALKGGCFRAFYRWLDANYRQWFPDLPERTRLQRLLRDYAGLALDFLADPTFFTVVDTYGIELIHPRREGRSRRQIGKKGKSHGRWIVGIKLAWLINNQGEVVDWDWTTANEADNVFRPLATGYEDETIALADFGGWWHITSAMPASVCRARLNASCSAAVYQARTRSICPDMLQCEDMLDSEGVWKFDLP